jgi:hydrogenase maturation factor
VLQGDAVVIDGHDNVVLAQGGRPVAVVGVDGVVVVDAGDVVLVVRKERAQDVRKAVEEMKRRGRTRLL